MKTRPLFSRYRMYRLQFRYFVDYVLWPYVMTLLFFLLGGLIVFVVFYHGGSVIYKTLFG